MELLNIFKHYQHTKIRDPCHVLNYTLTISLAVVYLGLNFVYLSTVDFTVVAKIYGIDFDLALAEGLFQAVISIGGIIGAVIPVYLITKLSRRQLMFLFNILSIVLCLASLYPNYKVFLLIRFLQGAFSASINSIAPLVIKQNSPPQMLTLTGACTNFFIIFGIFFSYLFGFLLGVITGDPTGQSFWQIVFLFPAVPLVAQLWLMIKHFPYQTVKYLAQQNRAEELRSLLGKFYRQEFISELEKENLQCYKVDLSSPVQNNRFRESKAAFIVGVFYAFMRPVTGFTVILLYSKELIATIFPSLKPILGAFNMFLFLIFSTVSLGLVQKYGRKYMAILGMYGLTIAHTMIGVAFIIGNLFPLLAQVLSLGGIAFYFYMFGMTYGPILWIWLAQALQPRQIGYAVLANWTGSAITALLYPVAKGMVPNQGYIFLFFAFASIICLPAINKLMIETKDKSEDMICEEYAELDRALWPPKQRRSLEIELMERLERVSTL